jgi:hypothetical protein
MRRLAAKFIFRLSWDPALTQAIYGPLARLARRLDPQHFACWSEICFICPDDHIQCPGCGSEVCMKVRAEA